MGIEQALNFLNAQAKLIGADQYDILAGESQDSSVKVYKGKVKETEISSSHGIGIRLFRDGRPGYSFTRRFSEDALKQCVLDAADLSQFSAPVDFTLPEVADIKDKDLGLWNDELTKVTTKDLLALSFELEKKALASTPYIDNVLSSAAGVSRSSSFLLNSKGLYQNRRRNSAIAGTSLVAIKNSIKKSGAYYKGTRDFSIFDTSDIVDRAMHKAVDLLDAQPIASGSYPVLFDHYIAPGIISSLMPAFYANSAQKGQSKLKDRVGEKIASSCFTLTNDPFVFTLPGSRLIDSEGVPTQKFDIVSNGTFNTFLYNLESASKEGKAPTGTGSRGYTGKAGTSTNNLFVAKGARGTQEILSSLESCLVVTKLEGRGIRSAISGEISIGCQGFLYNQGILTQAVDRITISGNYFDLLHDIQEFSNEYSDNLSSTKVPDMLISKMTVSG